MEIDSILLSRRSGSPPPPLELALSTCVHYYISSTLEKLTSIVHSPSWALALLSQVHHSLQLAQ